MEWQNWNFWGLKSLGKGLKSRRKLAAIEKIAPPKNRKSLQRILGLIKSNQIKFISGDKAHSTQTQMTIKHTHTHTHTETCKKKVNASTKN